METQSILYHNWKRYAHNLRNSLGGSSHTVPIPDRVSFQSVVPLIRLPHGFIVDFSPPSSSLSSCPSGAFFSSLLFSLSLALHFLRLLIIHRSFLESLPLVLSECTFRRFHLRPGRSSGRLFAPPPIACHTTPPFPYDILSVPGPIYCLLSVAFFLSLQGNRCSNFPNLRFLDHTIVVCPPTMAVNASYVSDYPPLPEYTLTPRPPLFAPIPDNILALILPIVAYWALSMIYHLIDVYDLFPHYRLHTPAEVLKRNHVTRWDVVRDVLLQQVIQTIAGIAVSYLDEEEYIGREEYDVAVWARRIRWAQRGLPHLLALFGIDALGLAKNLSHNGHTILGAVVAGGRYSGLSQSVTLESGAEALVPAFAGWELSLASFIYWYFIPALQFIWGVCVVDTWQYFLHRAMHLNRWLYGP